MNSRSEVSDLLVTLHIFSHKPIGDVMDGWGLVNSQEVDF